MTTVKKKVDIFRNKLQKQNRGNLRETRYQIIKKLEKRIINIGRKNENKKSGEIKKRKNPQNERACRNQKECT